jgi:prepilin-type N-terminal cleavage/methylation domain-containing protein
MIYWVFVPYLLKEPCDDYPQPSRRRRPGFTLVELLTVVAIISLLIGILLPSLSRARDQAKRLRTAALLDAIGKGIEMFHGDFKQYPDSSARVDPITDWPNIVRPAETP